MLKFYSNHPVFNLLILMVQAYINKKTPRALAGLGILNIYWNICRNFIVICIQIAILFSVRTMDNWWIFACLYICTMMSDFHLYTIVRTHTHTSLFRITRTRPRSSKFKWTITMTNEGRKVEQEKRNERHERKNGKKGRHERTLACSLEEK